MHILIATSTGTFAPLSPPNFGGRPEFEVPQNWGLKALWAYQKRGLNHWQQSVRNLCISGSF